MKRPQGGLVLGMPSGLQPEGRLQGAARISKQVVSFISLRPTSGSAASAARPHQTEAPSRHVRTVPQISRCRVPIR